MNSIQNYAKSIIQAAVSCNATDIHIIPHERQSFIQFRISGEIVSHQVLKHENTERILNHFKFLAQMDISEKRRPQNGNYVFNSNNKPYYLRLSTLPSLHDESLVIRIHRISETIPINHLSLFPSTLQQVVSLLTQPQGLLLFTGSTGSGKSTTLYTLLQSLKKHTNKQIITIEDPIEKYIDGFIQVQVNEKTGVTYESAIKASLRHDPDVIMISEIRDSYTAKMAIRAALTGHLVVSTLHSRNAVGSIARLQELGITKDELKQTLLGIAYQRLIKLRCPYCGEKCSSECLKMGGSKMTSVYELLYGIELGDVLEVGKADKKKSISYFVNKGFALGYVSKSEAKRWTKYEKMEI